MYLMESTFMLFDLEDHYCTLNEQILNENPNGECWLTSEAHTSVKITQNNTLWSYKVHICKEITV